MVSSWIIVTASRLNFRGRLREVILVCPSAWIGLEETSTWSTVPKARINRRKRTYIYVPRVKFSNVAAAVTTSRLILAVKGFDSATVAVAIPVWIILVGNTMCVAVMRFWCKAGITALSLICSSAGTKETTGVVSEEPTITTPELVPCKKFSNSVVPAAWAPPCGWKWTSIDGLSENVPARVVQGVSCLPVE